jgi:anti-anti-sigma factor
MEKLEHKFEPLSGGVQALRLKGTVDVFTYRDVKQLLDTYAKEHTPPRLYVDMADVQYVGSSGWSVFFLQASALEKAGGALCLGALTERVQRALSMIAPRKGLLLTANSEADALPLLLEPRPQV